MKKGASKPAQATIVDVARAASVSPQTVSNALNQPDRVKEATLERVRLAIAKVGYKPSYAAQALRGGASRTLALVTLGEDEARHFDRPYFGRSLNGMLTAAEAHGYKTLIHHAQPGQADSLLALFEEGRIDGAVIFGGVAPARALRKLRESGQPIALLDRRSSHFPCAHADYQGAMAAMVQHLAQGGSKHLLYLSGRVGKEGGTTPLARLRGFEEATADLGLTRQSRVVDCDWTAPGGRDAAFAALKRHPNVDAIVCASDDIACGALAAARLAGRKVGRGLRVVGFDASPLGEMTEPALTTVHVPFEKMAEQATLRLIERLKRSANRTQKKPELPREYRAETMLVERQS